MSSLRRKRAPMQLQLTSLLDMFTIILVFLLESFQAEDAGFTLHAGLTLPESSARSPFKPSVNIALSQEGVFVDGALVHTLQSGGEATASELRAGTIPVVVDAVAAAWKSSDARAEDGEVVASLQADEEMPYDTINLVMRSAAESGCYRFRLVVEKGD